MVLEGRGRELEVGVAPPALAVHRRQRGQAGAAVVVEGAEEPQLVLDDRPAHRARRLPVLLDVAREQVALVHVEEVRPEVLSGGGLVAGDLAELGVEGRAAVHRVAAGLGQDVDGGAGEAPVLGPRPERHDPHLLDGVVVDVDEGAEGPAAGIGGVDAVDEEHVLVRRAGVGGRALKLGGPGGRTRPRGHAGGREREVEERVPARRQLLQQVTVELRVDGGGLGVDDRALGRDRHLLLDGADGQGHVDGQDRRGGDVDVLLYDGLERVAGRGQPVLARGEVEEHVRSPRRRGGRSLDGEECGAGDLHGRPGEGRTVLARHRPRHLAFENGLGTDRPDAHADEKEGETHRSRTVLYVTASPASFF